MRESSHAAPSAVRVLCPATSSTRSTRSARRDSSSIGNNTRYEVANYPTVTIPTNLTVNDAVRTRFGEFYAALFDHALEVRPGAVVTEYS